MELNEVQQEADSAGKKAMIFGVAALAVSALFGWMFAQLSNHGPETRKVVTAAQDVPALTELKREHLKMTAWPASEVPKGAFEDPNEVLKTNKLNTNGLIQGEPILASRLASPDRGLGISGMVEPGMRAFVLQVDGPVATADLLHPGAFVDIIATLQDQKRNDLLTKVILQNVQVLAVGDSVDVEPRRLANQTETSASEERDKLERHRVVTLLVNIKDIEHLTLSSRVGKIDLSLRSNTDTQKADTQGATLSSTFGPKKHDEGRGNDEDAAPAPSAPRLTSPHPRKESSNQSSGPAIIKIRR